jgi:DNA-binding beta-propeller fold protein YncE
MSHQVLPINGGTTLAVTDAGTNSVDFFDPRSGALMSSASIGPVVAGKFHNPDGIFYEPKSHLLISVNGDSSSLSLIDTKSFAKVGDILIGKGKLETGAADGAGLVYINEENGGSVAVVDVAARKVVREFAMKNCEEPTGLVYDSTDRLVISVCSNGLAKFIASESAKEVASVKVGAGADALIYDRERHFVFSFGGDHGTLRIIALKDRSSIALVQTLKTKPGARLGALDPKTGRVYIPSASFGPPAAPIKLPGMEELPGLNPHTFEFLVIAPNGP